MSWKGELRQKKNEKSEKQKCNEKQLLRAELYINLCRGKVKHLINFCEPCLGDPGTGGDAVPGLALARLCDGVPSRERVSPTCVALFGPSSPSSTV